MPSPIPRQVGGFSSLIIPTRGSLPSSKARSAPVVFIFEACSVFTHVTACALAERLSLPLHSKLQHIYCLLHRLNCFRLERPWPGRAFTYWKRTPFHGALLKIENMNAHRRKDKVAKYKRPSPLIATRTGQVWSWDITYLPSRVLGKHFYCYLFMDVYSRKIVGWEVHERECGHLAAQLLHKACHEEGIDLGQLSLHQDNGSPMKAAEFLAAMAQLGITP
jgi:transposase InsO family protein